MTYAHGRLPAGHIVLVMPMRSGGTVGADDLAPVDVASTMETGMDLLISRHPVAEDFGVPQATMPDRAWFIQKRLWDICSAISLLIILSPLLLLCALAVALTSRGPVLFVQERVGSVRVRGPGSHGLTWTIKPFKMYKFRSMYVEQDDAAHKTLVSAYIRGDQELLETVTTAPGLFKLGQDRRITPVGTFLRRFSLDELPQLLNVLKGEMSMVGPRPPLQYEVDCYLPRHMQRFNAKPGITGLWQVMGRSELTFEEMVDLDICYTKAQSLQVDVQIVLKTFSVVLTARGAA